MNATGIMAGLGTAALWAATSVCFESSSRHLGTWTVNVLRLFAATMLFMMAGLSGFLLLGLLTRQIQPMGAMLRRATLSGQYPDSTAGQEAGRLRRAFVVMLVGTIFGPFLGVSLGLKSVQLLPAGVASTLMSIVPVLLVPVSAVLFREKVQAREVLGTVIAILGVAILAS